MRPVLALSLLLCACDAKPASSGAAAPASAGDGVSAGQPAPALVGTALSGVTIDLTALRGRVVLVDFWASWCEPCRREMPELEALHKQHEAAGLTVLGVTIDEQRADAEAFLRDEVRVSFPVVHDAGQALASRWGLPKMPTLYLVDRDGTVARVFAGYAPGQLEELRAEVARRLAP